MLWGRLIEVVSPSPDRLPTGPHIGACGGCHWAHFAYPAQAEWKQKLVREALARYAGIEVEVCWREDAALRLDWRTRADLHGDGDRFGFYVQGSHVITETPCPLLHPRLADAVARLREAGCRHDVTLTVNPEGDEVLAFGRGGTRELRAVVTAWNGTHDATPAHFSFDGAPIVNGCFSQASLLLNRLLRATVESMVHGAGPVFDAYCGNGNLSLAYLTTRTVQGMDVSAPAVNAARALGGDYRVGDEADMAAALAGGAWGTIILNPPRAGAKALLPVLAAVKADELIYVSCNPVALARDLKGLAPGGWHVDNAVALDLFPNTSHIETVVRLVR